MADKPTKPAAAKTPTSEPGFQPKAVHIGGESFVDRLLPHVKKIALGAIVITLVLSVYYFVAYMGERKQIEATDKLATVIDVADEPVRQPGVAADPKRPSYADAKERANAVLDAIVKQGAEAEGHAYRGAMLVDAGKLDEAITEYKLGVAAPGIDGVLDREGLGLAQEKKASTEKDPAARQKGLEEALATFKTMQPDETGPRRAYAMYHQGRILQLLGKNAEAKAAYLKAKELGKGTDLVPEDPRMPPLVDNRLQSLGAS
jgi:tetratricopeptide (TPR) repeat protein